MLTGQVTRISSQCHQVKTGGDLVALAGICKALFEMDDEDGVAPGSGVLEPLREKGLDAVETCEAVSMGQLTLSSGSAAISFVQFQIRISATVNVFFVLND
jgi:hypothetical protein